MVEHSERLRRRRALGLALGMATSLTLSACGGGGDGGGNGGGPHARGDSSEGEKQDTVEASVPVSIVELLEGDMIASVSFSATVESERAVKVHPQATGLVERLYAEEGDRVAAGQVLVRLNDDDAQLRLRNARIEYDQARRDSLRQADLFSKDFISRDVYEDAVYQAQRSSVAVEEAELSLRRTRILAPTVGIIAERSVELGDRVSPSVPVYEMAQMDQLVARVYIPGRHRPNLRVGQPARISSDMLPDYEITGHISRISPVIDPQSGTVKVTVILEDPARRLAPGMFANVALITERRPKALLAPKEAFVYDAGQPYVFVVRDDKAHRTRLEVGLSNARQVQIVGGLSLGDSIVVVGHEGLRDGATVRVVADAYAPIPPDEPQAAETDSGDAAGSAASAS